MNQQQLTELKLRIPQIDHFKSLRTGKVIPNQCRIIFEGGSVFQSYGKNIAYKSWNGEVVLDRHYWDYSTTTGKYRNLFLGESKAETQAKIDLETYSLEDLN